MLVLCVPGAVPVPLDPLEQEFGAAAAAKARMMAQAHRERHDPIEHRRDMPDGGVLLEMRRRQRSHEEMLSVANALKVRAAASPDQARRLAEHAGERHRVLSAGPIAGRARG